MDGDSIKEGLDGLSKIDSITDFLSVAMYWVAVIFIIVFVAYIFVTISCYVKRRKQGNHVESDDFLED